MAAARSDSAVQSDLVYDVGVNVGSDSAYYLSRGYRVIGIEASPVMAELLRTKFADEIAVNKFILLNVGVASVEGEMDFWLSDRHEWSSFDRGIASRNGTPHRSIAVPTLRFDTIVSRHGIPAYCKIDIEGNDVLCLEGMSKATAPPLISIEMSHEEAGQHIDILQGLGYRQFKIVSQITFSQPTRLGTELGYRLPARQARRFRKLVKRLHGVDRVADWRFEFGSSGPFGEDTPGRWHDVAHALHTWRYLRDVDQRYAAKGLGDWFDVHAKK